MTLQATQICNWNDIAGEVTAGTMSWNGTAQSGTNDITWSQFTAHVNYDGTNPAGLAATQCPNYNQILARVTTVGAPVGPVATSPSVHTCAGSWSAPSGGLAPTSYNYQFFQNGVAFGGIINTAGLSAPNTGGFTTGADVYISVQGKNGSNVGPWSNSPNVTVL